MALTDFLWWAASLIAPPKHETGGSVLELDLSGNVPTLTILKIHLNLLVDAQVLEAIDPAVIVSPAVLWKVMPCTVSVRPSTST